MHFPLLAAALLPVALAHGSHDDATPDPSLTWAERHMLSEHHISNYDPGAFFVLHDFNQDLFLTRDEILRTYGVLNAAGEAVAAGGDGGGGGDKKDVPPPYDGDKIWTQVRDMIDKDHDDRISQIEWTSWSRSGGVLPDFGTGVGHHGDDELEYELHHYEQYHENDKEDGSDMVMHPEDLEHFALHEKEEKEALRVAMLDLMPVNEANIPLKFRVQQK